MPDRYGDPDLDTELATFEPALAAAVVQVLRRRGVPASEGSSAGGEAAVLVPADRREDALRVLADRMEDIHTEARGPALSPTQVAELHPDEDDEATRPLVFERLRGLGLLPVLLIPLLVLTLANVRLPMAYSVVFVVGGMALVMAWRTGRIGGDR